MVDVGNNAEIAISLDWDLRDSLFDFANWFVYGRSPGCFP